MRVLGVTSLTRGRLRGGLHDRLREPLRDRLPTAATLKAIVAAVASYLIARALTHGAQTLVAPLTALLVTQVTVFETLTIGRRRVIAVVAGVLVAVAVSHFVTLQWWSLALILVVAFALGAALRLDDHNTEVAISAMLVFAVRGAHSSAVGRVSETLIGAAVGVGFSLVAAPVHVKPAGASITEVAGRVAAVLDRLANDVREEVTHDRATSALAEARRLGRDLDRAEASLAGAERSLRLNPRAVRFRATGPSWRAALAAFEHVVVSVREVARVLAERTENHDGAATLAEREHLAALLERLAHGVRLFGAVAVGDVRGPTGSDEELLAVLANSRESQARLAAALAAQANDPGGWTMNGALLQALGRIVRELDVESGPDASHVRRAPVPPSRASRPVRSAAATVRAARTASRVLAANRLPARRVAIAARARQLRDRTRRPFAQ